MVTHANRGMNLETLVECANIAYRADGRAYVSKVEVGWKVFGFDRLRKTVKQAFPVKSSTVDWTGVLRGGRFIAFETKETNNRRSFSISVDAVPQHQVDYLLEVERLGAIAFFLIWAPEASALWLVLPSVIDQARRKVVGARKGPGGVVQQTYKASLTFAELDCLGVRVPMAPYPDYLAIVKEWNAPPKAV